MKALGVKLKSRYPGALQLFKATSFKEGCSQSDRALRLSVFGKETE
jgi:hypothetical protein